jgi:hypothetical protein
MHATFTAVLQKRERSCKLWRMQMQERACDAEDMLRFLRLLLRKISGKLLVIWDGSPIHRAEVIKQFLAAGAAKRLHLERRELNNLCCHDLAQLGQELVRAKERPRHKSLQNSFVYALEEV